MAMSRFEISEHQKERPVIQLAPLIDIVFLILVFFMSLSIFSQQEAELDITVPHSSESKETPRGAGEIIVNIKKDGKIIVNQKEFNDSELEEMLKKVSGLFPNQPVIIRADKKAYHEYIVKVLDICARSNIWNIAFSVDNKK